MTPQTFFVYIVMDVKYVKIVILKIINIWMMDCDVIRYLCVCIVIRVRSIELSDVHTDINID